MADMTAWPAEGWARPVGAGFPLAGLIDPSLDPIFWPAERLGVASAWWPHVPFGHWVASAVRPRVLVELGTGAGVSYSAFCQAVVRQRLDTRCYGIAEQLAGDLTRFNDQHFGAFSCLIAAGNDEAPRRFADRSVDLLHFDGTREYEAARHGFSNWEPKLSDRAVVLLHNTNLRGGDFGIWRFWSEVCQRFPHFEFLHGNGLGVLATGKAVPPAIVALCGIADAPSVTAIRDRFAAVGERWTCDHRQSTAAAAADAERARAEAWDWEKRAKEAERGREQVAHRIDEARRHVYALNLDAEEARDAAVLALGRAEQAEAGVAAAVGRAEQAEAALRLLQTELEQAISARDALLSSTVWRATGPVRAVGRHVMPPLRRMLRRVVRSWR